MNTIPQAEVEVNSHAAARAVLHGLAADFFKKPATEVPQPEPPGKLTLWGNFIVRVSERLGNSEDLNDRIANGYLAALEHKGLPEDRLAFRIRTAVALRDWGSVPFSRLSGGSDDEDDDFLGPEEQVADPGGDPATIVEALQDVIVESAEANLEAIVDRETGKAIQIGNTERATRIAAAWKEYLATRLQPTKEPAPLWDMDIPKGEGKGEWLEIAEDAAEEEELNSADLDLSHILIDRREGIYMHASETDPELRPDTEDWPRGIWKAIRDTWSTPDFFPTMFGIWRMLDPRNETEKAWTIRYLASHLVKQGKIEYREQFYGPAISLLGLPKEWLDCEAQEEEFGEDAVDSAEGEFGHISRILYGLDWEGWDIEELPEMSWPQAQGLLDSIESKSSTPWETAAFKRGVVSAALHGATWDEAQAGGWDAWRAARLSRPGARTYIRKEMAGESAKDASWSANNVDRFTRSTEGKIVGLTNVGLRVNGKGTVTELWDWEKCVVNAGRVHVERGKEQAFLAAVKGIDNSRAKIFATAFESALKLRV